MGVIRAWGVLALAGMVFGVGYASEADRAPADVVEDADETWDEDLTDLDLEGLMGIQVTSVTGVAQPLRDTPAAIHVITEEDIRRGGHLGAEQTGVGYRQPLESGDGRRPARVPSQSRRVWTPPTSPRHTAKQDLYHRDAGSVCIERTPPEIRKPDNASKMSWASRI